MKRIHNSNKSVRNISCSAANITQMNLRAVIESAGRFEESIEKKMQQFERQGLSASACTEYFGSTIEKYTAKLLRQLKTAHNDNAYIIKQYFHRRAFEKVRLENLLRRLDEEIVETTLEYNTLKQLVDKSDPLKNAMALNENRQEEDENE